MDPSDRLEEDFKFYLLFFKQNLKELQNEKDKALCQEWLQRLEGMRETRKQRRDRNVYLSQLALAMAEGQLWPPFNAPPPRDPLPMPANMFDIFRTGLTVYEKPQENQLEISSPSARGDTRGEHGPNVSLGNIKGKWLFDSRQTPENTVHEKLQTNQSEKSSLFGRADATEKCQSNENNNRLQPPEKIVFEKSQTNQLKMVPPSRRAETSDKSQQNGNINSLQTPEKTVYAKPPANQAVTALPSARADANQVHRPKGNSNKVQAPETTVNEKPQTKQSEMSSSSTRAVTSGKFWANVGFGKVKSKWNIDNLQAAGENVAQNSQTTLSEMSSLGSLSDKSVEKWLASNYKEDESNLALFSTDEFVPRNHQLMLFKIPLFYGSSDTSTEPLSETVNDEEKNKWSSDKTLAADEYDSRKSRTLPSGAPPCISSSDFSEEQLPHIDNSSENSKPSNEILLAVREMELHSRNLSDSQTDGLPNVRINPVKKIRLQQPEPPSKNHSDSWTKLIPRYRIHSKKKLNFHQPELQPVNYSYYGTCVLSEDKLNTEKDLHYQKPGVQSTNFLDSRINVLSKAKVNPDVDLQRPVVSRTCPRPSQMPLVEEKLETQSTNDAFVTSQWEKIVPQDKAAPYAESLASLLSYSKGQWLDQSCDSESFRSVFSFQSATSENPTDINRHPESPSVHSELLQEIRLSEKLIQSISLASLCGQSRSTPTPSSTSMISKGEQKYSPMSTVQRVQDQYTQTQPQHQLPQEKNSQKKSMFLPVYIVSADQQPFLLYTPLTASQIHRSQLIIPTASQMRSRPTSQHLQQRISSKTPKQSSKINATVHHSRT